MRASEGTKGFSEGKALWCACAHTQAAAAVHGHGHRAKALNPAAFVFASQHGELPPALQPTHIVLLIGTNNLGMGQSVPLRTLLCGEKGY